MRGLFQRLKFQPARRSRIRFDVGELRRPAAGEVQRFQVNVLLLGIAARAKVDLSIGHVVNNLPRCVGPLSDLLECVKRVSNVLARGLRCFECLRAGCCATPRRNR